SGSAGILEIALQLSELGFLADEEEGLRNQVRFAWWGAEEEGLLGSEHYVSQLSEEELGRIALNLNFDMIASPNYARFVYDGDGSASELAGPEGSSFIEWIFNEYFSARGLHAEPTPFSGRSDYGPFIEVGVPAGGLFTGAEGIKTAEQAGNYGGTAEEAYDPCYHAECDTIENINLQGLDEMADAAAHAVMLFGMKDLPQAAAAKRSANGVAMDYKGNHLIR
ncbi:MAG: M28 family peptidase, partial [Methylococcales bacterium]|nr:M28 family peptidase [Methylococcales bacterium]